MRVDPKDFKDTTDSVLEQAKVIDASPRRENFRDALGVRRRHYLKDRPDGKWLLDVPRDDPKAVAAIKDITRPAQKLHEERAKRLAPARTARMRTQDGRTVMVVPENERWLSKLAGAMPAPRYGGVSVTAGPDGMLWRDVAGYWVPSGRYCLGTPLDGSSGEAEGPQRDPDGNLWELNPDTREWEIRLYAEED